MRTIIKKIALGLFLTLFLVPNSVFAAIAFDASTSDPNPTRGGSSETFAHTVTGTDTYLVVVIARNDDTATAADDVTGVTYNGVAMTQLKKLNGNGGGRFVYEYIYGLANPATGAHNIVISLTGSTGSRAYATAESFTGVKQTGQPDAFITQAVNATPSATLTVVAANSWAVAIAADSGGPYTGTGVLTSRQLHVNGNTLASLDSNGPLSAGANTVGFTGGSSNSMIAISLAPVADAIASSIESDLVMFGDW